MESLIAATEQPKSRLCAACFTGEYPIALPDEALIGKHLLEDLDNAGRDMDPGAVGAGSASVPSGYGAEDAVRRP